MLKGFMTESVRRTDFDDKVEGRALYCADIALPGMLFAKTFRSTSPRARILSVHTPSLPDGYFIVDHGDVPGSNIVPNSIPDQPFFATGRVNYIGEPILLVVGPDRQAISSIMEGISVDYAPEKPILTMDEAAGCTSGFIYADRPYFTSYEFQKGDFDGAVRSATSFIEDEYETGYQEHAYLETQAMLAEPSGDRITVYGSMQCPYMVKEALDAALGPPSGRTRVVQLPTGGGFGGKEEYPSIPAVHAAIAALKTGRPVKLVFDRSEDMICTTKRHPSKIRIRSYLDSEGRITARDVDIRIDAGAYAGLSSVVLQRMSFSVCGVYNVENLRVRAKSFATNNAVSGAFRGFGGPQAFFAVEMHMEHIARELKVDSLELKRRYFLKKGDTSSTGGTFHHEIKLEEIADAVTRSSDYLRKRRLFDESRAETTGKSANPLKGIGCSVFFHGCGFTGKGEKEILKSRVRLERAADGKVEILVSSAEIGQGAMTTLRKIVARAMGLPLDMVVHRYPDTDACPDSGPTVASRTVMIVGRLLEECAYEMKSRNEEGPVVIERSFHYPDNLHWDAEKLQGNAYVEYAWGANVVEVEVDPMTFEVSVKGAWGAYDIGEPMDARIVEGQIEGGMAQGLGYAGMEVLTAEGGRIMQDNLTNYAIPTSMDFPGISSRLIHNPFEGGPFGARGLGELPLVGAAPAYALAVEQAIGRPVHKLPVTPELIMELMVKGGGADD
ncbi:MAG TPA: xanthine dehydrogenase family protein molybdopterin-binding subunit [Bacillota bacterium]|nr:xanthine dehydrogenase family protein [Bacillota bacterium]HOA15522.1 xanthine dehydrogenase family protein molybdopterin-binding subunit [Bacillota bacterium]